MNVNARSTTPLIRSAGVMTILLFSGWMALAQSPGTSIRKIVSDVLVTGNKYTPAEQITGVIRTRPGGVYRPEVVQDDVRKLISTGRFGNVEVRTRIREAGKIDVIFAVLDYPNRVQAVAYVGAKEFDEEELNTFSGIQQGAPLNPITNKIACQQIVRAYHEKGFPFASCTLAQGNGVDHRRVRFVITEGPQVYIRNIEFVISSPTGEPFVSEGRLKTLLVSKKMFLGIKKFSTPYNPGMVQADIEKLTKYYRSFGFHDVTIARELKWDLDSKKVVIIYHVHEGHRYMVKERPVVVGKHPFPQEELERMVYVRGGEFYDQGEISQDIQLIKDYIGRTGREARVTEKVIFTGRGECQVAYDVNVRGQSRVGDIIIVGNTVTRQNVILRQLPLFPGQILSFPALRESERNLARLGIFEMNPATGQRPKVSVLDRGDSEFKDILVEVDETRTGSLLFGVGFNSDAGATGSIVLNERNFDITNFPTSFNDLFSGRAFRGAGQEFRLEAVPGTELQRYTISFREPYLFDSDYSFSAAGYIYTRRFNEYDEGRKGGRITVGRRLNDLWRISGSVRLENVEVSRVLPLAPADFRDVEGDNFLAGFRLAFTRDNRDSILRATEGSKLEIGAEGVTGDYNFPIITADFSQYFTVRQRNDGSGRHVVAFRNQFGYAGSNAPVFERFFAGGFRTLRGFDFRGVGPDVAGFKIGGEFMLLNSVEYQIPLTANDQVVFVAFADGGTVERDFELNNYRVSVGFGFRLTVPFMGQVPIALDFGFPVVKADFDREQIFNFYLGINR